MHSVKISKIKNLSNKKESQLLLNDFIKLRFDLFRKCMTEIE